MNARHLETRIARLEQHSQPRTGYVERVSRPPAPDERAQLLKAKAEGRRYAFMPHRCATVAAWLLHYGEKTLQ